VDVVGIFDAQFRQILETAQPIKADVRESAKLPEHPLETGAVVNDHKIFNPIEITLTLFLGSDEYRNIYQVLRQLYKSNQLVTIQTHTSSYSNLTVAELPYEETPDVMAAIIMPVKFKELRLTTAQFGPLPPSSVRDPNQASTRDRGEQQGGTADERGSFLYRTFINNE